MLLRWILQAIHWESLAVIWSTGISNVTSLGFLFIGCLSAKSEFMVAALGAYFYCGGQDEGVECVT